MWLNSAVGFFAGKHLPLLQRFPRAEFFAAILVCTLGLLQVPFLGAQDEIIILDSPPGKLPNYLNAAPAPSIPFIASNDNLAGEASPSSSSDDSPTKNLGNKVNPSDTKDAQSAGDSKVPAIGKQAGEKKEPEKSSTSDNSPPAKDSEKPATDEEDSKPGSRLRNRGHQCVPPKDYPIGDIPLEILNYTKLDLPPVISKADPESAQDLLDLESHVQKITKTALAATVCVRGGGGSGSGVVISEDGWILTAAHVCIKPERTFTVIFPDGRRAKALTYGTNHEDDAGLMKIIDEGKWPHVPVARLPVEESAWTLCTGHPGGIQDGRPPVLRLGRVIRSCQHLVRTDNLIMPGDSGGPVFDMQGRVVAINSRIGPSQSLNYHVPGWIFLRDWDRLEKKESWGSNEDAAGNRGFLGVELERTGEEAKIKNVMPNLPAEKAGLQAGDVILSVNGKEVRNFDDLVGYLSRKKAGDKVALKVKRGDSEFNKDITLAEPPTE